MLNFLTKSPYSNCENDKRLLDSLLVVMGQVETQNDVSTQTIEFKPFDPNKASKDELEGMVFPDWLATRLVNYRATGARFN